MSRTAVAAIVSCLFLSACDPGSGVLLGDRDSRTQYTIDDSGLLDAQLLSDYSGRVTVEGYGGSQAWEVISGELPPGLALDADGLVTGTPTFLGTYDVGVRVSGELLGELEDTLSISVVPGTVDVQLGWLRDQTTRLTDSGDRMWDPWTRLAGAGGDYTEVTLLFALYAPGLDGINRNGRGDDEVVGEVDPADVGVTLGAWDPVDDAGEGIEYIGDATFRAHEGTGEAPLTLDLEGYDSVETRVMVTAPDWCLDGNHPGGPGTPGFCA